MEVKSYKDLKVWQKAMDLGVEVYSLIKLLPKSETYALSDQMRRAAASIPSNIAEGHGRNSTKEFINFLSIARGSQSELETQLLICVRLNYLTNAEVTGALTSCTEINKMLNSLINRLKSKLTMP